jgi:hypothetical protein
VGPICLGRIRLWTVSGESCNSGRSVSGELNLAIAALVFWNEVTHASAPALELSGNAQSQGGAARKSSIEEKVRKLLTPETCSRRS